MTGKRLEESEIHQRTKHEAEVTPVWCVWACMFVQVHMYLCRHMSYVCMVHMSYVCMCGTYVICMYVWYICHMYVWYSDIVCL